MRFMWLAERRLVTHKWRGRLQRTPNASKPSNKADTARMTKATMSRFGAPYFVRFLESED
jgi:hypothetical protein